MRDEDASHLDYCLRNEFRRPQVVKQLPVAPFSAVHQEAALTIGEVNGTGATDDSRFHGRRAKEEYLGLVDRQRVAFTLKESRSSVSHLCLHFGYQLASLGIHVKLLVRCAQLVHLVELSFLDLEIVLD